MGKASFTLIPLKEVGKQRKKGRKSGSWKQKQICVIYSIDVLSPIERT